MISKTPQAPYYAVIFTAVRTAGDHGYNEMVKLVADTVRKQPGYLGHEAAESDYEITVSYWDSLEAIRNWKMQTDHAFAQELGREKWYSSYKIRICKVERDYGFDMNDQLTK